MGLGSNGHGSLFWFYFWFSVLFLFPIQHFGARYMVQLEPRYIESKCDFVPGGGLGLGSHLKKRLHGRPQFWRLRAYQTTCEQKDIIFGKTHVFLHGKCQKQMN